MEDYGKCKICNRLTDKRISRYHNKILATRISEAANNHDHFVCPTCFEALGSHTVDEAKVYIITDLKEQNYWNGGDIYDYSHISESIDGLDPHDFIFETLEEAEGVFERVSEGIPCKITEVNLDADAKFRKAFKSYYEESVGINSTLFEERKHVTEASKKRFLQQVDGLTPEEIDELDRFFAGRGSNVRVDWQHLPDAQWFRDTMANFKSKGDEKRAAKNNPFLHFKDIPGCILLGETKNWQFILIQSWEAGKIADSFAPGGQGAKWCIGWATNSSFWDNYTRSGDKFVLAMTKNEEVTNQMTNRQSNSKNTQGITAYEAAHHYHGNFIDNHDDIPEDEESRNVIVGNHGYGRKWMMQVPTKAGRAGEAKAWHWLDYPDDCIPASNWKEAFGVTYRDLMAEILNKCEDFHQEEVSFEIHNVNDIARAVVGKRVDNLILNFAPDCNIKTINTGSILAKVGRPNVGMVTIRTQPNSTIEKLMFGFTANKTPITFDFQDSTIQDVDITNLDGRTSYTFVSNCHAVNVLAKSKFSRDPEDFLYTVLVGNFSYDNLTAVKAADW